MGRDYEPVKGQWYENLEDEDSFRVLSVDEDAELVEIEYLDGDLEELDLDAWHELDLEKVEQPEGFAGGTAAAEEEDDDDWEDEDEDEEDDEDDDDEDWEDEEEADSY